MKKRYIIPIIVGFGLLLSITLSAIAAMIAYACKKDATLFSVVAEIFVAAVGALLAGVAIVATLQVNYRQYKLDAQKKHEGAVKALNEMRNSLSAEAVNIFQFLQDKPITLNNRVCDENSSKNLQVRIRFSVSDKSELDRIGVSKLILYINTKAYAGSPRFAVRFTGETVYGNADNGHGGQFNYDFVTKINKNLFDGLRKYLLQCNNCQIRLKISGELEHISKETKNFDIAEMMEYIGMDSQKLYFIFRK